MAGTGSYRRHGLGGKKSPLRVNRATIGEVLLQWFAAKWLKRSIVRCIYLVERSTPNARSRNG